MIVTIGLISAYRSPKRNQRLLSLIILDIDYFKQHSDPEHDDTALLFIEKVDGPLYPVMRSVSVGAEYADFSD